MTPSLARFLAAQKGDYDRALEEIRRGRKTTHWMWYVFPQIKGLGISPTAQFYAINDLDEARAYLQHPELGPRLHEATEAVLELDGLSAREIFGTPDDLKLRSSATLFALVSPPGSAFHRLLEKFFEGKADARTLTITGGELGDSRMGRFED